MASSESCTVRPVPEVQRAMHALYEEVEQLGKALVDLRSRLRTILRDKDCPERPKEAKEDQAPDYLWSQIDLETARIFQAREEMQSILGLLEL